MQNIIAMIFMITQMSGFLIPGMNKSLIRVTPKDKEDETLMSGKTTVGGFGAPVVKFSEINDEFAILVGGCGGLIINHAFVIGGGGYGLVNDIEVSGLPYPEYRWLNFGYGGLLLGYVNRSRKLAHFSIHSLIGWGGLCYRTMYYDDWYNDAIFVFEPGIDLMLNVSKNFRIGLGGSYRFVNGVDLVGLDNDDISGPSTSLTFKFGKF